MVASALVAVPSALVATGAQANDLLIAPTRLMFEGRTRSTEVILKNIGVKAATYRVSLVARRMTPEGGIEEPETLNEAEALAEKMIRFAPRRVQLEPNQPQAVRIAVRKPADLASGEYRIHMLFRAIPEVADLTEASAQAEAENAMAIRLTAIYGITIPLIVRHGDLEGGAMIDSASLQSKDAERVFNIGLQRLGDRSVYGDVVVEKDGIKEPVAQTRGIAIYPEVAARTLQMAVNPAYDGPMTGTAMVRYYEEKDGKRVLLAEQPVTLG
ncbi:MAG: molecular chaperone [Pacificimonas sp.]